MPGQATDWMTLISKVKAKKEEESKLSTPTDWKSVSEITQYGMYGSVLLLMGAFLFDVYEQSKNKENKN